MYERIEDIKEANAKAGLHWFSKDTMKCWGSRIVGDVIVGRYFISSEFNFDRTKRFYTVRRANDDGSISTIGPFNKWLSVAAARRYLRNYLDALDKR